MPGSLLILTGPPGAGKSTVARLITEDAPRAAVHLHTDSFYVWIRTGLVAPYLPEAARQNDVVLGVIAEAACGYARGVRRVRALGELDAHVIDTTEHTVEETRRRGAAPGAHGGVRPLKLLNGRTVRGPGGPRTSGRQHCT